MNGLFFALLTLLTPLANAQVSIGSKIFTEGHIMAELAAQTLEEKGIHVTRHFSMGTTGILVQALKSKEIEFYPEYTGTVTEFILKDNHVQTIDEMRRRLEAQGLTISDSLGFNNTYALAMPETIAEKYHLRTLSDLERVPGVLRSAFSYEFTSRTDGLPGLAKVYKLKFKSVGSLEHSLAYQAIRDGKADIIDIYSTDAKIKTLHLAVLQDDRQFFPRYEAIWLARTEFVQKHPEAWAALAEWQGKISENDIRALNAAVDENHQTFENAVSNFIKASTGEKPKTRNLAAYLLELTEQHIFLVASSLLAALLIGLPLGLLAAYRPRIGQIILLTSSMLQTIPSLALFCFLIPLFGIGGKTALVALFIYSLLPIILNTYNGIKEIDQELLESAQALGLTFAQKLRHVILPLASPSILVGVRLSAIIGIGTATLAALIGGGGYGVPIVTGLAVNDTNLILVGALPATLLTLVVNGIFVLLGRLLPVRTK